MALSDSILRVKDKVSSAVSNFFYPRDEYPRDDRTAARHERRARNTRDTGDAGRTQAGSEYDPYNEPAEELRGQGDWTAPQVRESSPYQNTNPYQAPQPQAAGYQQPQMQNTGAFQAPQQQGAGGYQQPPQNAGFQQGVPQGQDGNILFFPNAGQAPARETAARVITARGVSDCYSAITQLRLGDMVILVMDGINDPAEMRHYVDMLSGACYSLRATITKLSRHGAYLICPSQIRVYVDAATNQLNSGARQPQRPLQNPYGQVRYAQGTDPYAQAPAGAPAGYDGMGAAQAVNQNGRDYYGRSAMPDARGTADRLQPYANGYMPDSPMDEIRAQ